jgi:hypothetical protein
MVDFYAQLLTRRPLREELSKKRPRFRLIAVCLGLGAMSPSSREPATAVP